MFAHLHVHTEYSLLDGACRISELFRYIKSLGQTACAITDHGVMYGAVEFYKAAASMGIKPIIGCEVYVAPRRRHDRIHEIDSNPYHLVLLCKDSCGYRNLCKLVSTAYTEGFYGKPRIDMELLEEYHEGLIALSACLAGQIPRMLLSGEYAQALSHALTMEKIFGKGNYYLELQDHGIQDEKRVARQLIKLSKESGIGLVATNDAHYITKQDAYIQDVLMCIQTNRTVSEENRLKFPTEEFYLKSEEEMAALFPREAIDNTVLIANRCSFDFSFGQYHLPKFILPESSQEDSREYLETLVMHGFAERYPECPPDYLKRLRYELDMITSMGFVDYFLIVSDFISFARRSGIAVGPGRGSAAGSIVSYCLRITDIDPMRYNLYFERFLNPERVSMPDIDIDFCVVRRQEVIDYVIDKYGSEHVAQIVTFGTMAAKAAVRDVGRALGYTYAEVDVVAKAIPFAPHMTIEKALSVSPSLRKMVDNDSRIARLTQTAKALEGMPRHASTHAAGVVITALPVCQYVPLAKNEDSIVTQFPMTTLEELGLLKMDFLGLRNLTVLQEAQRRIALSHQDYAGIPNYDAATFEMLSAGQTLGVFQLESAGMTGVCVGLKPQSIEDITAVVALFRPGPMDSIPRFIENKHHPEKISYKHELLRPILEVTYGCIVYQEQVLEIFRKLAGFSLGHADMVRRAMSKKKFEALIKEKAAFLEGCYKNGISNSISEEIFNEILDFANYAFNKAHAVSYAVIAYQTAYLKRHYPLEYMSSLLSSVLDSTSKIQEYIAECSQQGIKVCPPDINTSEAGFTVDRDVIRFGLAGIKNIGRGFINDLKEERDRCGPFKSFIDFCRRMLPLDLNRRALENLIKCGALDCFGKRRSQLLEVYEKLLDTLANTRRNTMEGQESFFEDTIEIDFPNTEEQSLSERLAQEREITGIYLSGHPMDEYKEEYRYLKATHIKKLSGLPDGKHVVIAGILSQVRTKTTRNNSIMAYAIIEDKGGSLELIFFSDVLKRCSGYVKNDLLAAVWGKLSMSEERPPQVIVSEMRPLTDYKVERKDVLYIKLPSECCRQARRVLPLLNLFPGNDPVVIFYEDIGKRKSGWCMHDERLMNELSYILGRDSVVLKNRNG